MIIILIMAQKTRTRARMCLFGDFFYITPHLGSQNPKNNFGRELAFSSQTRKIEKRAYYQNYCIDSNQIDKYHRITEMPFVGGLHTRVTYPRWRTAAILENRKNLHISGGVRPILTIFGRMMQFEPLDRSDRYKFEISKGQNRDISTTV